MKAATVEPETITNPFYKVNEHSDVKVIVGEYILHLESYILTRNSPVFSAMLKGGFREGKTKRITLKEKEPKHVIEMFKYFHPQTFPLISGKIYLYLFMFILYKTITYNNDIYRGTAEFLYEIVTF